MVGVGWEDFAADVPEGVPLTERLFAVGEPGDIRYLDVGLASDRVAEWQEHRVGPLTLRTPPEWWVTAQDDRWVIWPGPGGPRVRIRFANEGPFSAHKTHILAEKLRIRMDSDMPVGHGFFNGLPWSWVDTGFREDHATASMFIGLAESLAIVQTEIPDAAEPSMAVVVQKIIATVQRVTEPAG